MLAAASRRLRSIFIGALILSASGAGAARAQTPWNVTAVPRVRSIADSVVPLDFVGVVRPLRRVHVYASTLQDASSGEIIGTESLRLCYANDRTCADSVDFDPATRRPIVLVILGGHSRAGTFSGQVSLAADSASPTSLTLSVAASSPKRKLGGALALILGVLLSWSFTVGLRRRIIRDQGRLLAARVRERIPGIRARAVELLEAAGGSLGNMPGLDAMLVETARALSDDKLEAILPGPIPNPIFEPQTSIDAVAQLVAVTTKALDVIEIALNQGLAVGLRIAQGKESQILTLITDLESVALNATPETVLASVGEWLGKVRVAVNSQADSDVRFEASGRPLTQQTIALRIQTESLAGWAFWALVTSLLGYFAVIESNHGFGLMMDYAKAFAWGLGITLTGQSLQQLTPSTVTNALTFTTAR